MKKSSPKPSWVHRLKGFLHQKPENLQEVLDSFRETQNNHPLNGDAFSMIEGALKISQEHARDVMVPKSQMITLPQNATVAQVLPIVTQSSHSRFPVITESRDEILGILLAKDLLQHLSEAQKKTTYIKTFMRPAILIPESKRLDILLREFRVNRNHMAIVVDEYGHIAGLITIEDVLEEIVGEIEDETDITHSESNINKINDSEYTVKALTPVEELNRYFNTQVSDEDFDTFGGYLMQCFGHIPTRGESIQFGAFTATIVLANNRQLQLIRLTKLPENE